MLVQILKMMRRWLIWLLVILLLWAIIWYGGFTSLDRAFLSGMAYVIGWIWS